MNRITHATKDTNAFGAGKHGYKTSAPYSVLAPDAMNPVQEELARAVEAFGVALSAVDLGQLATILTTLMSAAGGSSTLQASSSTPVFATPNDASAHPGSASNKWKLILRMPVVGDGWARLYAGSSAADRFALTINAQWDPASGAQVWGKDTAVQAASIWRWGTESLTAHGRASGAGTWADSAWTTTRGDLTVGGAVSAGAMTALAAMTAASFSHASPVSRTATVSLLPGTPSSAASTAQLIDDVPGGIMYWLLAPGDAVSIPVPAPDGGTLGQCIAQVFSSSGTDYAVAARRSAAFDFVGGVGSLPSLTSVDTDTGTLGAGAAANVVSDFGGLAVSKDETYHLRIANTGVTNQLRVYGVQRAFTDPGPRNV